MHCENTDHFATSRRWALEPELTPLPARWAMVIGVLVAGLLISLAAGPVPVTGLEEWHGNVSASQSGTPQTLNR